MTKPNRRWKGWRHYDAPSEVTVSHIPPRPLTPEEHAKAAKILRRHHLSFLKQRRQQGIDRKELNL